MKGISMPAVLQVINLERQSCSVEATCGDRSGSLHFHEGSLVHAQVGDSTGEAAALELLSWTNPDYKVTARSFSGDFTLNANITQLLLEAARLRDESEAMEQLTGSRAEAGSGPKTAGENGAESPAMNTSHSEPPTSHNEPSPATSKAKAGRTMSVRDFLFLDPLSSGKTKEVKEVKETEAAAAPTTAPRGALDRSRLDGALAAARATLGGALLAADICLTVDGTSLAGYQSQPATCALFNHVAAQISRLLPQNGLPTLGRYLLAELEDKQLVLLTTVDDLQLTLVADSTGVQLGMLLNVALPEIIAALRGNTAG